MAAPAFGSAGTQLQGNGSTMDVDVPDGVVAGSFVVVTAFVDTAGGSVTGLASDFVHFPDSPVEGENHQLAVMWHRATGTESSAGTYNFTLSGTVYRNAQAIRYDGVITTGDPFDVTNAASSGAGNVSASPDVADTTTVADTLGVHSATNWSGGSWTPASGFTERRDIGDGVCTVGDKTFAAAGATGTISATSTSTDKSVAHFVALKSEVAATESSAYSPRRLPGRIGPDGDVFLPGRRFDNNGVAAPVETAADTGTLVLSGVDVTFAGTAAANITTDTATLTLPGVDPTLAGTGTSSVTVDTGTLALTGVDPTTAGSGAANITADTATLVLSGVDVTVSGGASAVTADTATLALTGVDPTFTGSGVATTTADVATLTLSGVDVTLTAGTSLTADTAVLTLTGVTPTIAGTGAGLIAPDTGLLGLVGVSPALAGTGTATTPTDPATLVLVGAEVAVYTGGQVTPDTRTLFVPNDRRTLTIDTHDRTWPIPTDPRIVEVN